MKIVAGVDLLYLPRFKASLKRGGEIFLRRVFKEEELTTNKARGGATGRRVTRVEGIPLARTAFASASWRKDLAGAPVGGKRAAGPAFAEASAGKAGPRAINQTHHLAGIFAAKEAVIKALSLPTDSWQEIHVKYSPDGAPKIEILNPKSLIINHCLSISHDGNYVIAEFVAILEE